MQDMNERPEGLIDDRLAEEAALWLARMQSSDATEDDRQRFQNWLKADPAHVTAFEEMRALWSDLGNIELLPATDKNAAARVERSWQVWRVSALSGLRQSMRIKAASSTSGKPTTIPKSAKRDC